MFAFHFRYKCANLVLRRMIIVAVYCLMIGHPGLAFKQGVKRPNEAPIHLYPVYKGLS
jgi:hypothetical protein